MATKSSISINYTTTAGKKGQKAITDVNPAATNEQLKNFAQSVNALTTNVYGNTNRVDRTPLAGASSLQTPQFFLLMWNDLAESDSDLLSYSRTADFVCGEYGDEWVIKTDTPAMPEVVSTPENSTMTLSQEDLSADEDFAPIRADLPYYVNGYLIVPANDPSCLGEFVIRFPETDTFAAATVTFTVTGGE